MLDKEGEKMSDPLTLKDISNAIGALHSGAGTSLVFKGTNDWELPVWDNYSDWYMQGAPYLFPDAVHDLDLLDRSVAAQLVIENVEHPTEVSIVDTLNLGVFNSALVERLDTWQERQIPGPFVDRFLHQI